MEFDFLGSLREEICSSDLLAEVCCFPMSCHCSVDLDGGGTHARSHKQLPRVRYMHPAWPWTGRQDQQMPVQLVHLV